MGLFNMLTGVATRVVNHEKEAFKMELERCAYWDDERLKREAMNASSIARKMAYIKELQNRGYSSEDIT